VNGTSAGLVANREGGLAWVYPLVHWPMLIRQFANIKRNVEDNRTPATMKQRSCTPELPEDISGIKAAPS